jgi:ABC-2 type transport system permease protein
MRGMLATIRSAYAEVVSNKRALIFQVLVMIFNDIAWVGFWLMFFRATGTVKGWDRHRIALLQAMLTTSGGFTLGLLANARSIGSLATEGRLDATLGLPVAPLSHVLIRRIDPSFVGDLIFGVALFFLLGHPTPTRFAIFLGCVLASIVVLTSFLVITGSLSFFTGKADTGELGFHSILLMANYPLDLFGGGARLIMYTVVPAAFVSTVPAKLIDTFDVRSAATLAGVAIFFASLANIIFHRGLRRYASGSVWTRA